MRLIINFYKSAVTFSVGKYLGASVSEGGGVGVNIKLICRLKQHSFFNLDTLSNLKGITR